MNLTLFTQAQVLRQVGRKLLVEFFSRFTHLLPSKYSLPNPCPDNDYYFDSLAWKLGRPGDLPESLIQAMHEIEATAASLHRPGAVPEDDPARNPENTASDRLRQAIDLWLAAPKQSENGLAAAEQSQEPFQPITPLLHHSITPTSAAPLIQESINPSAAHPQASATPHSEIRTPHSETPHSADPVQQSKIEIQNSKINGSSTPSLPESDSETFARLARLPVPEYDRVRRAEAKRLHLRLASLDDAVDDARTLEDDAQANDVYLNQLKPWPEPILDAPALFDQVHDRYPIYLWLPPGAAVVLTLWPAHAHAFAAFTLSPRLNFTSTEAGCGKSTAFDVLGTMCPKVLCTHNLKTAVLFRVVHLHQPTLLLDELDSYLHLYPELRGLLNAGHKHGGSAFRCEGRGVRFFKVFAPTALAGIGHLSHTLRDRSIVIPLAKAPPGALQARFDSRRIDIETTLGRKLARWAQDNFAAIAACDPVLPPAAHNRLADNWRPLFAIAQVVGGHWPQRAADAFQALNPKSHFPEQSKFKIQNSKIPSPEQSKIENQNSKISAGYQPSTINYQLLLTDLRSIFAQAKTGRLFSTTIVDRLRALPDRPWSEAQNGHKPIDEAWLALQLRPLAIASHNVRIAGAQAKGYRLIDFIKAFDRFLGELPPSIT